MSDSESSSPIQRRSQPSSREDAQNRRVMRNRQNEADSDEDRYDYKRSIDTKSIKFDEPKNFLDPGHHYGINTAWQSNQGNQGNQSSQSQKNSNLNDPVTTYAKSDHSVTRPRRADPPRNRSKKSSSSDSSQSKSDSSSDSEEVTKDTNPLKSASATKIPRASRKIVVKPDISNNAIAGMKRSDGADANDSDSDSSGSISDSEERRKADKLRRQKKMHKKQGTPSVLSTATPTSALPVDSSGKVDINKLVASSTGTGLLAGGAMPFQLDDDLSSSSEDDAVSCNICTGPLKNVVKLKCKHKFCYGCIKGYLFSKQKKCPYCQDSISPKLIHTILTDPSKVCRKIEKVDEAAKFYWVYDSRGSNGWWNFDTKSNQFLERDYQNWLSNPNRASSTHRYTLMVIGQVMEIDFNLMAQINPTTGIQRRIDRVTQAELKDLESRGLLKGIGGITSSKK